jgi:hypothetical protein
MRLTFIDSKACAMAVVRIQNGRSGDRLGQTKPRVLPEVAISRYFMTRRDGPLYANVKGFDMTKVSIFARQRWSNGATGAKIAFL